MTSTHIDSQWLAREQGSTWHTFTLRTTDESAAAVEQGFSGTSSHEQDVWATSGDAVLCEAIAEHDPFQARG